jgi:CheY-like chemotaxis protein
VDADPRSLRVLEVSLRKAGYSVTTSGDVDGALELLELVEPDMILSDTRLPGKDGFQLVAALRANSHWADIPLVFLSSDPSVESKMRGLSLGVEDYLTKPVYIREILTRVNLAMQRKEREGIGRTSKTRFAGSLSDMGLVDLLQTIDVSRKSGVLRLASGLKRGSVFFNEGRVLDAELGGLSGEAAIYRFLLWSEGEFELDFREVRRDDKLSVSTQGLLMEGMRRLDEWSRLQEQLPSMATVFDVNHDELSQRLAEIPDEINVVLRLFDGRRTLAEVLEESASDDLATLNAVSKLYFEGFLLARELPAEAPEELLEDMQIGAIDGPYGVPLDSDAVVPSGPGGESLPAAPGPSPDEGVQRAPLAPPSAELLAGHSGSTSGTASHSKPLASIQLKRVAVHMDALGQGRTLPAAGVSTENVRIDSHSPDGREVPPSAGEAREQQDDMAKQAKRKSAQKDGTPAKGNVIPLHVSRLESSEATQRVEAVRESMRVEVPAEPRPEPPHAPRQELHKPEPVRDSTRFEAGRSESVRDAATPEVSEPAKGEAENGQAVPGRPRAGRRHRRSTQPPVGAASNPPPAPAIPPAAPVPVGVTAPSAPESGARPAAASAPTRAPDPARADPLLQHDAHSDDHLEVQRFFSQPPSARADDHDFDHGSDHEPDPESGFGSLLGKRITLVIAGLGLLLIGGFLVYNKLLMPTPPELGPAPVALPTPDLLRAAPSPEPAAIEPSPAPTPEATSPEVVPAPAEPEGQPQHVESPSAALPELAPSPAEPTPALEQAPEAAPAAEPLPAYQRELEAARKLGFRRSAEAAYQRALAVDPRGSEALSGLSMLYLNQGKNLAARDRAQEAVTIDPKNSEGWIVLAASLSSLGDAPGARKAYQECAALEGKYVSECRRMLR